MTLQNHVTNALNGQSAKLDVGIWEDLKVGVGNPGLHALVGLKLKQEARARATPNSEDFTISGLPECPSERYVADLVTQFYQAQGFRVTGDYDPSQCSVDLEHNDGRKVTATVTTSPGIENACASVTSSIYQ